MSFVLRLRAFPSFAAGKIDRFAGAFGALGPGTFAWSLSIGAGVGVAGFGLREPKLFAGILKSRTTLDVIRPSVFAAAAGVVGTVGLLLLLVAFRRWRRDPRSVRDLYRLILRRAAVLSALPFVVALRQPIEGSHEWWTLGFVAIAATLATYSAYHWFADGSGHEGVWQHRWPIVAVGVGMLAYAAAATYLSIANHLSFNTGRSDLGYYMSIFRQSSQGIPLGCSVCGEGSHLTGHFDPILVLLSPLYLLHPFSETILLLQTVWLTSGAVPLYLLARHELGRSGSAAALALSYLAFPALHGVNFFDFHSIALCIPVLLWLLYFLELGSWRAYAATLALALLVREDLSIAISFLALSVLFSGRKERVRAAWTTLVACAAYFVVAKGFLMGTLDPLNTGGGARGYAYFYEELIPPGGSAITLLGTVFANPVFTLTRVLIEPKARYVALILLPLLGLPLIARGRLRLGYGVALTLLATRPFLYSINFQYSSVLIPFLFGLAASALGDVRRGRFALVKASGERLMRALAIGVLVSTVLTSWKFGGLVPNRSFAGGFRPLVRKPTPEQLALDFWLKELSRSFPRGARVAANSRVLTHLGSITHVFLVEERYKADYVVVNSKERKLVKALLAEEAKGQLTLLHTRGEVRVYKTKYPPAARRVKPSKAASKAVDDD